MLARAADSHARENIIVRPQRSGKPAAQYSSTATARRVKSTRLHCDHRQLYRNLGELDILRQDRMQAF